MLFSLSSKWQVNASSDQTDNSDGMQAVQNLVYSLTTQNLGEQQACPTQVRLKLYLWDLASCWPAYSGSYGSWGHAITCPFYLRGSMLLFKLSHTAKRRHMQACVCVLDSRYNPQVVFPGFTALVVPSCVPMHAG